MAQGYINKANAKGASYFDIGAEWNKLTGARQWQRWEANKHFLDVIGSRGDPVLLSLPRSNIQPGTYLQAEVDYLTSQLGYRLVNQWSFKKGN